LVADGINEKGLAVAELYFPREAKYKKECAEGKVNLTSYEVIAWFLGTFSSITEIENNIEKLNVVAHGIDLLGGIVVPLHFIVSDHTGRCIVIESNSGEMVVKENKLGVMTNSPEFEWHIKNLNNYIGLSPKQKEKDKSSDIELAPFGQGGGTLGLPGGFTPPERFVKMAYLRQFSVVPETKLEAVNTIFRLLNSVVVPKGAVIKRDGSIDHTQYISIIDTTEKAIYVNHYNNMEILKIALTPKLLKRDKPKEWPMDKLTKVTELTE
jgi:penicillin V amidase